jgi:hypothetical protein
MIDVRHRRWVGRLIRVGLVGIAVLLVLAWIQRKSPVRGDLRVQAEAPAVEALGAGDLRIFNRDSSVNLILQGANILAGLSPKTVAKVRADLEASTAKDTSGLGGSIAQLVKNTVAGAIGTHVVYPIRDIREIEYRGGQIVVVRRDGSTAELFKNIQGDNKEELGRTFPEADARRFVEAVRARQAELGSP